MKFSDLFENVKPASPLDISMATSRGIKPRKVPLTDRQKVGFDRLKYQGMWSKCQSCGGMRGKHKADCQADR